MKNKNTTHREATIYVSHNLHIIKCGYCKAEFIVSQVTKSSYASNTTINQKTWTYCPNCGKKPKILKECLVPECSMCIDPAMKGDIFCRDCKELIKEIDKRV